MIEKKSPGSRALDALIDEAKDHLVPPAGAVGDRGRSPVASSRRREMEDAQWARMEASLLAASAHRPRERWLRIGGVAMAAAAAAAVLVLARRPAVVVAPPAPEVALGAEASLLRSSTGDDLRVGGRRVSTGETLRAGDELLASGRAVFERPARVSWLIEPADHGPARARVTGAAEALVLALDEGAIEAQVVPVRTGEAFAVDVDSGPSRVRIAVHGTHLRVDRSKGWVTVDLTEGVIAIGVPPASGITTGTTVRAPAHVRFDVRDLATLEVTSSPVRPAIPLGAHEAVAVVAPELPLPLAPAAPHIPPHVPALVPSAIPAPEVAPRAAILAAVRACAVASRHDQREAVRVTLSSELELHVSPTGAVESAQFSPPLAPEIQACAAKVIYRTKLDETGTVLVPIDVSY